MCIVTATTFAALGTSYAVANAIAIATNTVLALGAVAGVAGSAMGAVSSYNQGKTQKAQYEAEAKVAQKNAKIAQNNADQKRQEGIEAARTQRIKTLQAVGAQQTAIAANGIDISQGSALDLIEDTAAMGELDAITTRYNAESQAQSYEMQRDNFNNQTNLDIIAGQNAYKAGKLKAFGQGLETAGKATDVAISWISPTSVAGNGMKVSGNMQNKKALAGLTA
ncbi:hypothetical protein IJ531_01450 [bacterium]|nr:hypothetical protein [bacterium]